MCLGFKRRFVRLMRACWRLMHAKQLQASCVLSCERGLHFKFVRGGVGCDKERGPVTDFNGELPQRKIQYELRSTTKAKPTVGHL